MPWWCLSSLNVLSNFATVRGDRLHSWTCHPCRLSSYGRGRLCDHVALRHWDPEEGDFRDVACADCGARFPSGRCLAEHVAGEHAGATPGQCAVS